MDCVFYFLFFEKKIAFRWGFAKVRIRQAPVRLARPRTLDFHSSDRGSNPLRETIFHPGFKRMPC
jgi:hypothetical protein